MYRCAQESLAGEPMTAAPVTGAAWPRIDCGVRAFKFRVGGFRKHRKLGAKGLPKLRDLDFGF